MKKMQKRDKTSKNTDQDERKKKISDIGIEVDGTEEVRIKMNSTRMKRTCI